MFAEPFGLVSRVELHGTFLPPAIPFTFNISRGDEGVNEPLGS
jgi:hypothetical protein